MPTPGSYLSPAAAPGPGEDFGVFKAVSLAVTGLKTVPSGGLRSGTGLVVEWSDTNTGTLPAAGSFIDLVTVTNTTTGAVLGSATVPYNAATRGNLAAGASAAQHPPSASPTAAPASARSSSSSRPMTWTPCQPARAIPPRARP